MVTEAKKIRSLSEILIEGDKTNDILKLKELSEELYDNKQHYKMYEVTFGLEHLIEKGKELQREIKLKQLFQ